MDNQKKIIITLFIGVLMGALDISIVGPAIPSIEKTVNVPPHEIGWIFSIYILFSLIEVSLFAKLSDKFGRRNVYILSVFIFGLGSLWVSLSDSFNLILTGRAIQGFGASGIFPVASAVIGDVFPPEKRGRMLGLIGMVFGIAFILGPPIAGILLRYFNWNMLFLINIPIAVYLIISGYKVLPSEKIVQKFDPDWHGIAFLGLSLTFLTLGFNFIDTEEPVSNIHNITLYLYFGLALIFGILLIYYEQKHEKPIINVRFLKSRQVVLSGLLAIGTGFFQAMFSYLPKLAVDLLDKSDDIASFMLIPVVVASAAGSPFFGRMLDKYGSRVVVIIGMLFISAGFGTAIFWINSSLLFFISGIFIGLGFSVLSGSSLRFIMLNESTETDRASNQGLITIFISVGTMINATILGVLTSNQTHPVRGYTLSFLFLFIIALTLTILSFFLKRKEEF